MPMDRAEPRTICIAASTSLADRSFIFSSAISRTCLAVTVPAVARPGFSEPLARLRLPCGFRPAAFFSRKDAGGVFVSKVKDLSA